MAISQYPTEDQIQELLKGPADTPVVMLNLLRFKEKADGDDADVSGQLAYGRYAERMRLIVEEHGGRFIWTGRIDSQVIGATDEGFHVIGLVEYPSRATFVKVMQDPRVAEIGVHRANGLKGQWLIAATPAGL
jgi:uncharacterized protein (DUF1330 family)